jgi:hypothetical protein
MPSFGFNFSQNLLAMVIAQAMLCGKVDLFYLAHSRWSLEYTEDSERFIVFGLIR